MKGDDIEPSLKISDEQWAMREQPYGKRLAFWHRQAAGNQAMAWRRLREIWKERDGTDYR